MTKKVTKKSFAASPFTKKVRLKLSQKNSPTAQLLAFNAFNVLFLNVHYAKAVGIAALQQFGFGMSVFRSVIARDELVEVSKVSTWSHALALDFVEAGIISWVSS